MGPSLRAVVQPPDHAGAAPGKRRNSRRARQLGAAARRRAATAVYNSVGSFAFL